MCGICGFITKKNITIENLKQMNDTMYHRGPDDSSAEIYPLDSEWSVGMAQRRLSIIDLSEQGHQPMHSVDKRISVVFNGEIYNFLELKKELSDYPFISNCDTEVIIAAYLKWGIACVDKFNGMFAIAIYDRKSKEIYLIRDRIGKKPLYYYYNQNDLIFASELKPIMKYPEMQGKVRKDIISRYLYQSYINAPDTIFKNIYKLEPGAILRYSKNKIEIWKYWDIKKVYHDKKKNVVTDYEQAKQELKRLLIRSVELRMISDVPLGTFLSGGYDSSLITAIAQSISNVPVKSYSIGFFEEQYNEAGYARAVAEYLGTDHTELYIDEKEMLELVQSISTYYDEPFADSSQIPSMLVASLAKKNVTVVLSGDGGDEFFCGYNVYDKVKLAQWLDIPGEVVYRICNVSGIKRTNLLNRLPFKVKTIVMNRNKETKTQIAASGYINAVYGMVNEDKVPALYQMETNYIEKNWQKRRMLLDMDTYLPGDILCKVDRATMKYSLEARCPILDKNVMEYSYRLPHFFMYEKQNKKRILKDIAYEYIPKRLLDRPKVGFGVPLDKWLRGALKEQLLELSNHDYLVRQDIFDADFTEKFLNDYICKGDKGPSSGENYSKIVWAFYVFQQWWDKYIMIH